MFEFFSSSPTFSYTDLAQAIYLAFRGSPKLCLALSVTSVIDSLHMYTARTCTHTHDHLISDHVSQRKNEHTMGMFGVHRRVVCSCWICAICRFRSIALCNPRILENLQIAHPSADCADPANAPNRRAGPLMKIVYISSSDRTFKITIGIFTGQNLSYPICSPTKDTRMLLALLDKPVQPEDVQKNVHRDDQTSTSSNRRNFWAVLEMMAKRDDTLREHLETGRKNAQHTSRTILNEVIDVVDEYFRKEHTRSLDDENAFFSIMANGTW